MKIAVLLPCHNEEQAIPKVIADFKTVLPGADIYVCDNASSDRTAEVAKEAGAAVVHEPRKGKGNAVRRLFADVDADIYLMADGDGTYDFEKAPEMVEALIQNSLDIVVGVRAKEAGDQTYRRGHRFGNRMLNKIVHFIFDDHFQDMLSGYRVFSRRFVKTFPSTSLGFEIETELTIHALELRVPMQEMETRYFDRIEGTKSKLSTYKDGFRILGFILFLFKEEKPFIFFGLISAFLALIALIAGAPVVLEYFETGLVPRFPTLIVATGVMITAFFSFLCGLILDSVSRGRHEQKHLAYLSYSGPSSGS